MERDRRKKGDGQHIDSPSISDSSTPPEISEEAQTRQVQFGQTGKEQRKKYSGVRVRGGGLTPKQLEARLKRFTDLEHDLTTRISHIKAGGADTLVVEEATEEIQDADTPLKRRQREMQRAIDARKDGPSGLRVGVQKKDSLLDRAASRTAQAISSVAEMIEGKIIDLSTNYADGTPDVPFEALMAIDQEYEKRHPQPELRA